jgi:hypothetical protein
MQQSHNDLKKSLTAREERVMTTPEASSSAGPGRSDSGPGEPMGRRISSAMDARKDRAIDRLMGVADTVRRLGDPLQEQSYGKAAEYTRKAAERLDEVALYLRERDTQELIQDLRGFARRQPAVFLGIGFLAGAVCGRFIKSSAGRRAQSYS